MGITSIVTAIFRIAAVALLNAWLLMALCAKFGHGFHGRLLLLEPVGYQMEQPFDSALHVDRWRMLVRQIDKAYGHGSVGIDVGERLEYVFVQSVGFAHLTFYAIAVDRVLESAFRHAHKHSVLPHKASLGYQRVDGSEGISRRA